MADAPIIQVDDLWHSYMRGTPMEHLSLRGVSLTVQSAEIVGLVGRTGSGKSTLLQHLNGLLLPQRGRVRVNGIELGDPGANLEAVRQSVGLIFQYPEDQLFEPAVGDDVAFGPRNLRLSRPAVRERVREALEAVGLGFEAFKDRATFSLSGGEMRRVAIAGVLAMKPKVLALDDPLAGLDPGGRASLLRLLADLRERQGLTIVLVSHALDEIADLVDRLYVLAEGRVVASGSPRQLFRQRDLVAEMGLRLPEVPELMQRLRSAGVPVRTDLLTVEEAAEEIWRITKSYAT